MLKLQSWHGHKGIPAVTVLVQPFSDKLSVVLVQVDEPSKYVAVISDYRGRNWKGGTFCRDDKNICGLQNQCRDLPVGATSLCTRCHWVGICRMHWILQCLDATLMVNIELVSTAITT